MKKITQILRKELEEEIRANSPFFKGYSNSKWLIAYNNKMFKSLHGSEYNGIIKPNFCLDWAEIKKIEGVK